MKDKNYDHLQEQKPVVPPPPQLTPEEIEKNKQEHEKFIASLRKKIVIGEFTIGNTCYETYP